MDIKDRYVILENLKGRENLGHIRIERRLILK
jgi:hypothetical protein